MDWTTAANFNSLVWGTADEVYGRTAGRYPSFLPQRTQAQFERVRQARLLYRGRHYQYFVTEQRTQHDLKEMSVNGRTIRPYYALNVLGLISSKTADLLFGEDAEVKADDELQQAKIAELAERASLAELFKDAAVMASWGGQVYLESCVHQGQVYVQAIAADEVAPVGTIGPDRQYRAYVRYLLRDVGPKDKPRIVLLETYYEAGIIRRELWDTDGGQKTKKLDIAQWAALTNEATIVDQESTGVPWPTITWVPNELEEGEAVSDYDGLIGLQDLVNAKQTQIANVLAQHSDPAMAFPADLFDQEGNIRMKYKVFPMGADGKIPAYITWEGQLDAAMKDRSFALSSLLITAEMSPALLGLKEGAAPDAYKKLRLEASNALSMAARKAKTWRSAIRLAIDTAQALDQSIPGNRYDRGPIGVNLRDGIPVDEKEQAETMSLLAGGKPLASRKRLVSILVPEAAAAEAELAEIERDDAAQAAANTPTVQLGDATTAGEGDQGTAVLGGEEQSDAVASNDLRQTVGGSVAVRDLQKAYYAGELPRAAAVANLTTVFGFTPEEAEAFLPEKKPDAPGAKAAGGTPGSPRNTGGTPVPPRRRGGFGA